MQQGTVVRKHEKGYGFIGRDGYDKDLFFHANSLVGITFDQLQEGTPVQFEVEDGPKGPNAVKVSLIG